MHSVEIPEMKKRHVLTRDVLTTGIEVYNAYTDSILNVKAILMTLNADMVARHTVMRTKGKRAKSYCEVCEIVGLFKDGSGIYCPHNYPRFNLTQRIRDRENRYVYNVDTSLHALEYTFILLTLKSSSA